MESVILVANLGSSSKKYAVYRGTRLVAEIVLEQVYRRYQATLTAKTTSTQIISESEYESGIEYTLAEFARRFVITSEEITAIGLRVVSPGTFFTEHRIIDDRYHEQLETRRGEDPIHIEPVLSELNRYRRFLPETPVVAVSDSAFHTTIRESQRQLPLPISDVNRYDLRHFGYHGISVESVVASFQQKISKLPKRLIVCHLGSGSSITALIDGQSAFTSMGYSPLGGLLMSSRPGDIDPGAILALMRHTKMTVAETEEYLYTQAGLKGISGSADMKHLLEIENTDPSADLAIEAYIDRAQAMIGGYTALLGGLDAIVFTGTIGERSALVRQRISQAFAYLGLRLDMQKNQTADGVFTRLDQTGSKVAIYCIATNENLQIAARTRQLLKLR